ncbi:MAG TPA: hypothetical protein VGM89_10580 [Puia sp.]
MIVRNLPPPAIFIASGLPLVFADHVLVTGTTETPFALPEHQPGMGPFGQLQGTGIYTAIPHPGAQPLFLFFHTALSDQLTAKKGVDWRWLERVHPRHP